ncbi:MAG: hypothetical protein Q4A65_01865 [Bacillota bacterium]|nr:hypothetical protein [Bacillota bacterium]
MKLFEKKKIWCLALSGIMAFSISSIPAFAATGDEEEIPPLDQPSVSDEVASGDVEEPEVTSEDNEEVVGSNQTNGDQVGTPSGEVTGVETVPGRLAVILKWEPVDGAVAYNIYRARGKEKGNEGKVTSFGDSSFNKVYSNIKISETDQFTEDETGKMRFRDGGQDGQFKKETGSVKLPLCCQSSMFYYGYKVEPVMQADDPATEDSEEVVGNKSVAVKGVTVRPAYITATTKANKPLWTKSKGGKEKARIGKGKKIVGVMRANGRWAVWCDSKKDYLWFGQVNMKSISFHYSAMGTEKGGRFWYPDGMNEAGEGAFGNKTWAKPYSPETCMDFINNWGITSNTDYAVWLSKGTQHVYIFNKAPDGTWVMDKNYPATACSSGKMKTCTPSGVFKFKKYQAKIHRSKFWYYQKCMFNDVNSIHTMLCKPNKAYEKKHKTLKGVWGKSESVPYQWSQGAKLKVYFDSDLGKPKSKGCTRVFDDVSDYIKTICGTISGKKIKNGTTLLSY